MMLSVLRLYNTDHKFINECGEINGIIASSKKPKYLQKTHHSAPLYTTTPT
jgi:hypothetical protein